MSQYGQLTLARSEGKSLTITTYFGEEIIIEFYRFSGKQCRVKITAPKDTNIVRSEKLTDIATETEVSNA